jgi:peptidoglycan/xylan/chitin deacetylase (PgdA/CDA1 family)
VSVSAKVHNLCFHGIGTPRRPLEPDEGQYWIAPEQFDELLEVVRRDPTYRITFDDGNASDVEVALPALRRHGLTASFFIVAGRLGQAGSVDPDGMRELRRAGMTIGSHGMRHRQWRSLDEAARREELVEACERLAGAGGGSIDAVACPFGAYDRRVLVELRDAGFSRVYTVDGGATRADAWLQARYAVRDCDSPQTIESAARDGAAAGTLRAAKRVVKRWR